MACTNMGSLYCLGGTTWETEERLFSSFSTNCQFRLLSNDVEMVMLGNGLEYDQDLLRCCVIRKVLVIPFYQPSCLRGTPKSLKTIYEKSEEKEMISEIKTDTESKYDETYHFIAHTHENGEVTILRLTKKTTKQGSLTVDASETNCLSKEEKYEMESEHFSDIDHNGNILLDSENDTRKIIKCFRKRPVLKERGCNETRKNNAYDKELNNIIDYDSGYEIEIVVENAENGGPEHSYSSQCADYFSDLKRRRRDLKKRNEAMMSSNSCSYRDFVNSGHDHDDGDDDDDDDRSKDVKSQNSKDEYSRYRFDDTPDEEPSSTGESYKGQSCRNVRKTRRKRKSITFEYHERTRKSKRRSGKVQR